MIKYVDTYSACTEITAFRIHDKVIIIKFTTFSM